MTNILLYIGSTHKYSPAFVYLHHGEIIIVNTVDKILNMGEINVKEESIMKKFCALVCIVMLLILVASTALAAHHPACIGDDYWTYNETRRVNVNVGGIPCVRNDYRTIREDYCIIGPNITYPNKTTPGNWILGVVACPY